MSRRRPRLCCGEVYELLNGGVGLVIRDFDLGRRFGYCFGSVMKERVCQRATDALLEEDEHGGDSLALIREPVTVAFAIALQQAVALPLAEVITELGHGVGLRSEFKGGPDGFMNLRGPPASELGAAVK